jgi:prepilin-type N-terminal cleavage/methylation domain-containing protein
VTGSRSRRTGVTLVEVLVASMLLAVNALAMSGVLVMAIDLTRRAEAIALEIEEGAALPACAAACPALRPRRRRPRTAPVGFTLVEVLISLAVAGVVVAAAAGFVTGGLRTSAALTERAVHIEARLAIPAILMEVVSPVGSGVDASTCALGVRDQGRLLEITRLEADGSERVEEVFAAMDGGGRPALFLRHRPFARQPFLEEVRSFEVTHVEEAPDGRVDSLSLRLVHERVPRPIEVTVLLPHRPCLAVAS